MEYSLVMEYLLKMCMKEAPGSIPSTENRGKEGRGKRGKKENQSQH